MEHADRKKNIIKFASIGTIFFIVLAYFLTLSFYKYRNYLNTSYDLAIYCQAVWGLSNVWYYNTVRDIHIFAHHVQPVLFLLTIPFRLFHYSPYFLLFIQSFLVSLSIFIIYYICRKFEFSFLQSLIISFLFFLYPPVQNTLFFEFHPGTLGMPVVFILVHNLYGTKLVNKFLILLSIMFLLSLRENYTLILAPLFIIFYFKTKSKFNLFCFFLNVVWFVFVIIYLKPFFNKGNIDTHFMYFSHLGNSYSDILKKIIFQPLDILKIIFSGINFKYLIILFSPLLFIPFVKIKFIISIIPILLINLLSNHPGTKSIEYHFNNEIVPIIYFSVILFLKQKNIKSKTNVILILLFFSQLIFSYYYGKLPVSKKFNLKELITFKQRRKIFSEYNKFVGADHGIATEVYAIAHYADRRYSYIFPRIRKGVKWIIYDSNHINYISGNLNEKRHREKMLSFLLKNKYYKIAKEINGIKLLNRERTKFKYEKK